MQPADAAGAAAGALGSTTQQPRRPPTGSTAEPPGHRGRPRPPRRRSPAGCARECPWDREQDERSIVPHTVEEAYELADAAQRGDDAKLLDELGDVLFQVHFLSLLLEERGAGDLAAVAEHCRQKLIRRHPHVFGEVEAETAGEVLRNWDRIKQDEAGREPGIFGEVPENLPGPLYARKVQRRAATSGFDWPDAARPARLGRARSSPRSRGRRRARRPEAPVRTRSATCCSPP